MMTIFKLIGFQVNVKKASQSFLCVIFLLISCNTQEKSKSTASEEEDYEKVRQEVTEKYTTDDIRYELLIRAETDKKTNPYIKDLSIDISERDLSLKAFSNDLLVDVLNEKENAENKSQNKLIYGNDNRLDIYQLKNSSNPYLKSLSPLISTYSRCVLIMIDKNQILDNNNGTFSIRDFISFAKRINVCTDEPFFNQPSIGNCTAFAFDSITIISAGHCLDRTNFRNYVFMFDFVLAQDGVIKNTFSRGLLYYPLSVRSVKDPKTLDDFSLIKVSKKISNDRILPIDTTSKLSLFDKFYVIGCPYGLPLKFTDSAFIRSENENSQNSFFRINADTYHGNSGSPVFLSRTNKVVGILVRGDTDFVRVPRADCYFSMHRNENDGRGEDVTRIKRIFQH